MTAKANTGESQRTFEAVCLEWECVIVVRNLVGVVTLLAAREVGYVWCRLVLLVLLLQYVQ